MWCHRAICRKFSSIGQSHKFWGQSNAAEVHGFNRPAKLEQAHTLSEHTGPYPSYYKHTFHAVDATSHPQHSHALLVSTSQREHCRTQQHTHQKDGRAAGLHNERKDMRSGTQHTTQCQNTHRVSNRTKLPIHCGQKPHSTAELYHQSLAYHCPTACKPNPQRAYHTRTYTRSACRRVAADSTHHTRPQPRHQDQPAACAGEVQQNTNMQIITVAERRLQARSKRCPRKPHSTAHVHPHNSNYSDSPSHNLERHNSPNTGRLRVPQRPAPLAK